MEAILVARTKLETTGEIGVDMETMEVGETTMGTEEIITITTITIPTTIIEIIEEIIEMGYLFQIHQKVEVLLHKLQFSSCKHLKFGLFILSVIFQ
jgi:hypothetical protein